MIRRLFFAANGLCAAILTLGLGLQAGPEVEEALFPIRGEQSIKVTERTAERLCWDWTFVKLRLAPSDNDDAFLTINGQQAGIVAPYDRDTGYPWGTTRFAVGPRREPYVSHQCIALPPAAKLSDTLAIRQVAYYDGFLRLWRLSVPFPDVVSEGTPPT